MDLVRLLVHSGKIQLLLWDSDIFVNIVCVCVGHLACLLLRLYFYFLSLHFGIYFSSPRVKADDGPPDLGSARGFFPLGNFFPGYCSFMVLWRDKFLFDWSKQFETPEHSVNKPEVINSLKKLCIFIVGKVTFLSLGTDVLRLVKACGCCIISDVSSISLPTNLENLQPIQPFGISSHRSNMNIQHVLVSLQTQNNSVKTKMPSLTVCYKLTCSYFIQYG